MNSRIQVFCYKFDTVEQGRFSKGLHDACLIFDIFRPMSMSDWM